MSEPGKGKRGERALSFLERLQERGKKMAKRGVEQMRDGLRSDEKKEAEPTEER